MGHIDFQDLFVVVASLYIASDDAAGAQCLARLSIEELESLLVVLAFAEVLELVSLVCLGQPRVLIQNRLAWALVEVSVADVAK